MQYKARAKLGHAQLCWLLVTRFRMKLGLSRLRFNKSYGGIMLISRL